MIRREDVFDYPVPAGSVALWWLGQSSFLVKSPGGKLIAIDPYLSNACKSVGDSAGINMDRITPVPMAPADLVGVDAYVMTHGHEDHLDPQTLNPYRQAGGRGPFVAPAETAEKVAALGVAPAQILVTWPNKSHSFGDLTLRATFAIPMGSDDMTHVGYLARIDQGPTVYFTGDTRWHDVLIDCVLPHKPDVLVAVINPFGNLSPEQAARLARGIDARIVIPSHYDLFPDNSLPPRLLRSNLILFGIGERYRELRHGQAYVYPEPAVQA